MLKVPPGPGAPPLPTKTVAEVAAERILFCDWPDDGSAHKCPGLPRSRFELMSIVKDNRTYSCCEDCWTHKIHSEVKTIEQFEKCGGYDESSDPPVADQENL